jgi:hypothetical protein
MKNNEMKAWQAAINGENGMAWRRVMGKRNGAKMKSAKIIEMKEISKMKWRWRSVAKGKRNGDNNRHGNA